MALAAARLQQTGYHPGRPEPLGRALFVVAACVVGLTLGQAFSNLVAQPAPKPAHSAAGSSSPTTKFTVKVERTSVPGQFAVTFPVGTSADQAQAALNRYGLTLVSGDPATGRYLFQLPQVEVTQISAGTALAVFPPMTTRAEAIQFLASNNLRLLRWERPAPGEDQSFSAEVALPVAVAAPTAAPAARSARTTLPRGLAFATVNSWARAHGLRLLSYNPATGSTSLQALNQYRPVSYPPAFLVPPSAVKHVHPPVAPRLATMPPATVPVQHPAPPASLFVSFKASATQNDVTAIATSLGLQLTSVGTTGLMLATVDAGRAVAIKQMLSDNAAVSCVGDSLAACSTPSLAQPATTTPPSPAPVVAGQASSAAPVLSAETLPPAGRLAGTASLSVSVHSSPGPVTLAFSISGPLGSANLGTVNGQVTTADPTLYTASQSWDSSAVADGTYTLRVVATDAAGKSAEVDRVYRVQNAPPTAPSQLGAAVTGSGVALTWQQAAVAEAKSYRLFRDQVDLTQVFGGLSAEERSFIDAGVTAGNHHYDLFLVDGADHRSNATTVDVAVPSGTTFAHAAYVGLALLSSGQPLKTGGLVTGGLDLRAQALSGAVPLSFQYSADGQHWQPTGAPASCTDVCRASWTPSLAPGHYLARATTADGSASSTPASFVISAAASAPLSAAAPAGASTVPAVVSSIQATVDGPSAHLSWAPVSDPGATYSVYRIDPNSHGLVLAASGIEQASFTDRGLQPGQPYGYTVITTGAAGQESSYSAPVFVQSGSIRPISAPTFVSPRASTLASGLSPVLITTVADAALTGVAFSFQRAGTSNWGAIPDGLPINLPAAEGQNLAPAGGMTWASTWNTSGLVADDYILRAITTDALGRTATQMETVRVDGLSARGPPVSLSLQASPISTGVRLTWTSTGGTQYQVLRSALGVSGPFEIIGTSTGAEFFDRDLVPGTAYSYQVVQTEPTTAASAIVTAVPLPGSGAFSFGNGSITIQQPDAAVSIDVIPLASAPQLPAGLTQQGLAYAVGGSGLDSGKTVRRFAAGTALTVNPGPAAPADSALYQWNVSSASWEAVGSTSDTSSGARPATLLTPGIYVVAAGTARKQAAATTSPAGDGAVELTDRRTAMSRTYRNPDGSMTTRLASAPINYLDSAGAWQPIDSSLVAATDGDYAFKNGANAFSSLFKPVLQGDYLRLDAAGESYGFALEGAAARSAQSLGASSLAYAGVFPGVDLTDSTSGFGVKETLVLADAKAPNRYRFVLTPPHGSGLRAAAQADGSWAFFKAGATTPTFVLSPADAFQQPLEGGEVPVAAGHATTTVTRVGDRFMIDLAIDQAWLTDPSRRFPVYVDPSLTLQPDSMDAYWHWNVPTDGPQWDNSNYLHVGDSDAHIDRAAYQFDLGAMPTGVSITNAQLGLYYDGHCISTTVACGQYHTLEAHRLTSAWNYNSTTSQLTYDSTVLSSQQVNLFGASQWYYWPVTTAVQNWYSGSWNNNGLIVMRNPDNVLGVSGPVFPDAWYSNGSLVPQLTVTWTAPTGVTVPGAPTNVSATASDKGATVSWSAPSVTGGAAISSYTVRTYNASNQQITVQNSNNQSIFNYVVCGSCTSIQIYGLGNGNKYWFSVTASNSAGAGAATNSAWMFTPPDVNWSTIDPNQGIYTVGQVVTLSMTVANHVTDTAMSVSSLASNSAVFAGGGGPMTIDGNACTASSAPACTFNGSTLTVGSFNLAAGTSHAFSYQAVVQGLNSGCQQVGHPLAATNAANIAANTFYWLNICDSGLGLENWWSYIPFDVGPQAQAMVNVSNGNLVLQQTDSTPIQAHGSFAYVLRRTYNSQDTNLLSMIPATNGVLGNSGQFGVGWQLNVDDLSGGGVGTGGLLVPKLQSILNPLSVTLTDRDGTRHVFTFKGLGATVSALDLTTYAGAGALLPVTLGISPNRSGDHICIDQNFQAPPGVHLGLWRYVEITPTGGATCQNPQAGSPLILGFAAERPDRIRYEFSADGHMLDMRDGNGVDLRYQYLVPPLGGLTGLALGPLTAIYEARSCNDPFQNPKCRAFRFTYLGTGETDISDPAGRTTRYYFSTTNYLTKVINPDGSQVTYNYCNGTQTSIAGQTVNLAQQLCSMTDPAGKTTTFSYSSPWLGPNQVTQVTDRRGVQTNISYNGGYQYLSNGSIYYQTGNAFVNQAGEQHGFYNIDGAGRVGERDDGIDQNNYWKERTFTYWDQDYWGYGCRRPDAATDNNPCEIFKPALNSQTADQDTLYVYNDEGQVLNQHRVTPTIAADEETTYGYHAQYFKDDNSVLTYDDNVSGGGDVQNDAPASGPRNDAHSLFVISDKTQMLSARGNTPGAAVNAADAYGAEYGYRRYLTTYVVDNNSAFNPNAIPSANTCAYPSRPTANTGNVCEVDGPSYDGIHPTVTRYTYDTFGQRLTMTTPKEIADNPHWSFIQSHYNVLSSGMNGGGTGGTTLSDSFGSQVTAGNRVFVVVSLFSTSGTSPTATSVGGTTGALTKLTSIQPNDTRGEVSVWTAVPSITGSYGVTVNTNVASDIAVSLAEYSGLSTASSPVDVQVVASGNAATPSSGPTPATTAADELVLGVYADEGGGKTMKAGAGYTPRVIYGNPWGDKFALGTINAFMSDQDSGPSGSTASCLWKSNTNNNWACMALVIKLATPASTGTPYSYTYYVDGTQASNFSDCDTDLSGSVCAGGWLKGVTDPNGKFVAFAYDAAGDVTRTWDRNATNGYTLSQFPGSISSPTNSSYSETLRAISNSNYDGVQLSSQNDTILPTARQLVTSWPTAESGSSSLVGTSTGWGELYSQGNTLPWGSLSVEPAPTGHGWLWDSTQLEGNTIQSGNWQAQVKLSLSTSGSVTGDLHVRAYRYTPGSGLYTLAADLVQAGVAVTSAASSFNYVANGSAIDFNSGDKLYMDALLNVTGSTAAAGATLTIYMNNAQNGEQLVGPNYSPTNGSAFAPYMTNLNDNGTGLLGLSGRQLTVAGSNNESGAASALGTALGWGELLADGTAAAWPAAASAPVPSGHGWVLDTPALEGRTIGAGVWQANGIKFNLSAAGVATADVHVREYKRSAAGVYTLITDMVRPATAITSSHPAFSFSGPSIGPVSFASGDKLYQDVVLNVTSNTAPAGTTITIYDNNIGAGEQLITPGSKPTTYSAYSFPWRFITHSRTPDGNTTYTQPDLDGNVGLIRPPRGYAAGSSAYDITQTFDAAGNVLSRLMPAEAAANQASRFTYDSWSNLASMTDADGNVTVFQYDDLNRQTHKIWTRGPWPTDQSQVPTGCRQSTSSDAPIPSGRILCSTTTAYDAVNNPVSVTDASGQTTQYLYDAFHRKIEQLVPRNDGSIINTRTDFVYDANGNLTDVCSPDEFTSGLNTGCVQPAYDSQHTNYDFLDRPMATTTYRQADAAPVTELIQNGGFESGLANWTAVGTPAPTTSTTQVHGGTASALLGPTTVASPGADPYIYQQVTIPQTATRATLSFWYFPQSDTWGSQNAYQQASIRDTSGNVLQYLTYLDSNAKSWTPVFFDLTRYAGETVQIWFDVLQDNNGDKTSMYLDDVSLKVQSATSGNPVQSGGFENGSTGWVAQGLKPGSVSNARAHTGYNSALLGWTTSPEPEGDSSIQQTVSIPVSATRATLSFWYFPSTTDTGNDRQEVWVLDTNGNKLAQVLSTHANNQAWLHQGFDLTPFAGQTIVLWFNVHGFQSTGLTSMYIDDVALTYVNSSTSSGSALGNSTTTFAYDADGNRIAVTDPNGNTVSDTFDYLDRHTGETKPRDNSTSYSTTLNYDPAGHVTSVVEPNGHMTAYSYDVNGRPVDTVQGSDNTVAGSAGLVDANGGKNVRTRVAYDRDGHVFATYDPRAFAASTSTPDASYMHATDFNVDGLPITTYSPRYGNAATDLGLSSTQTSQCPTGASPQVGAYPSDVGVCIAQALYDPAGQRVGAILPTSSRAPTAEVTAARWNIDTTANSQSFGQGAAAGDTVVLGSSLGANTYGGISAVSDNGGNSWSQVGTVTTSDGVYVQLWAAYNVRAFTQFTLTYAAPSGTRTNGNLGYIEYAGGAALHTVVTGAQSGGTSLSAGPTPVAAGSNELAVSMTGYWSAPSFPYPTGSSGWTTRIYSGNDTNEALQMQDMTSTAPGEQTANWTASAPINSGQILAIFYRDNRYVTYNYTDDHLLQSVTMPDPSTAHGRVTAASYLYDADGRPVKVTDALGHVTTISYFADGLKQQECGPPNGSQTHCTTYAYDANGNVVSVTDPRGLVSTSTYYADNKLADFKDGALNDTHYVYDLGGRAASVCSPSCMAKDSTNPSGTPTSYQYFKDNLLQWSRQPFKGDGSVLYQTTYGYDSAGLKTSQDTATVNSSGGVISDPGAQTFAYYNDDRLNTQTGRAGSGVVTNAYDPAGNIKTASDNTGSGSTITSTFYLDSEPRTVDNGTKTNKYTYDGAGRTAARVDVTDSGGATASTTTYTYGDSEVATSMYASAGSGTTSYMYNQLGQTTQENDPNSQYTTFSYFPDNTLSSKVLKNSSNTTLNSWAYQYDAAGHITQQLTPSKNSYYWYDNANRLCYYSTSAAQSSCSPATYTYDHDGNRLTAPGLTFTYNADDSMNNVNAGAAFSYTPYQAMASDGSTSFGYDGLGRMSSAGSTSYQNDAFDRQRSVGSTTIHYDGFSQTPAIETTGTTDKVYALDPFGRPKSVQNGTATAEYLTDDGHGNIANVTGSTQAVTCSVQYDPWGNPIGGQGTGNPCQSGGSTGGDIFYRSSRRDPNTGNYQFGYRTYDPTKAGFLSSDVYRAGSPEQNQGLQLDPLTMDRYNYVNGDPVNLVDFNGHKVCSTDEPCYYQGRHASSDSGSSDSSAASSSRGCHCDDWWNDPQSAPAPGSRGAPAASASRCPAGACNGQALEWKGIWGGLQDLKDYTAQHIASGDSLIGAGAATVDASGAVGVRSRTAITRGYISDEGDIYTSEPLVTTRSGVAFDKEFADRARVAGSAESDLTISRDGEFLSASTELKYLNAAKIAGRVGIGVGLVAAGYQEYQDDSNNSRLSGGQKAARVAAAVILEGGGATVGGLVGGRIGGVVGATLGGALGALCGPFAEVCVPAGVVGGGIVGTVVGGAFGGAVGGWLGDKAKQALFSANPFGWFH